MSTSKESTLLVRVFIPEINAQKCVVVNPNDTVKAAQLITLEKIAKTEREAENYGLYLPSSHGRPGKFLDEERLLTDYALQGHVPQLEFRYRCRDFMNVPGMTEKQILKSNTKANQKKFVELVAVNALRKVEKALATGLDANFITDDGNTPLGIACGRFGNPSMILTLVSGGTQIEFCGKEGLLPIHRAAIGGNAKAIKTLLSLGASPNSKDAKGLTPLYHAVIMGDHPEVCETLLKDYATVNLRDKHQWTELHHACKHGYTKHIDLLLRFKADISAKNNVGNTPLHVAASHGQVDSAMLLLKRGADKQLLNHSHQPANQVAILCGHHHLSSGILRFTDSDVDKISNLPQYNPHAKRPSRASHYENFPPPHSPTPTSIAQSLLLSAVQEEQKKIPSSTSDISGTPKARSQQSATHIGQSRPSGGNMPQRSLSMAATINRSSAKPSPGAQRNSGVGIPRDIYITKGPQGYGFAMRGIKIPTSTFKPTPEIPAFQFVGSVDRDGSADKASLKVGDYLIEANGQNIITSTHDEVVNIIMKSGKKLHLKVVTPTVKPAGLTKAQDSPRTSKKQQTTTTSTSQLQKIPAAPSQVTKSELHNDTQKTAVPRKPPPPPLAQNSKSIVSPSATPDQQVNNPQTMANEKRKLTKANTIDNTAMSKQQTAKLTRQLSEEPVRPPSQFAAPTEIIEESNRNSVESEDLSPFAIALKKASLERIQRISTNQPRMSATVKNENITDISEDNEPTPPTVTQQGQVSSNLITLPLAKVANKAVDDDQKSSSNLESADSTDFTTSRQQSKATKEKVPISKLIKRFSGEDVPTLENYPTQSTPTEVKKTDTNFDQQQLDKMSSSVPPPAMKKTLSNTKVSKTFDGEKANDGTYNWRNILRTVPKSSTISKDTTATAGEESVPSEDISSSVPENFKGTNRQMQGSPITTKTSKTSLLAKKFERNSMIKAENTMPTKTTDENSKKALTGLPMSIASQQIKQDAGSVSITNSSFVTPQAPVPSNDSTSQGTTTSPMETTPSSTKTEEQPLRRQSAVVMIEETDFSKLPSQYDRNSFSVDSDYWNSPEHTGLSTVLESNTNAGVKTENTEAFPTPMDLPDLDILPPPMLSDDDDTSLAIEGIPPPDISLPPEISFLDQLQDLPPPLDFPDTDDLQLEETSPLPAPDNTFDMNVSDLPSPSQLPPPMEDFNDGEISFSSPIPEPVSNQVDLPPPETESNTKSIDDHDGLSHEPLDITPPEMLLPPAPLPDSELPTDTLITSDASPGLLTEPLHEDNSANDTTLPPPEIASLNTSDLPPPIEEDQNEADAASQLPMVDNQLKPQDENKSEEPQGGGYKSKPVKEWTVDDVCSWLDEIGLEEHIEMFWDNEIQGEHLVDMTKDDLKELGITRLGHRMTIANGIAAFLK